MEPGKYTLKDKEFEIKNVNGNISIIRIDDIIEIKKLDRKFHGSLISHFKTNFKRQLLLLPWWGYSNPYYIRSKNPFGYVPKGSGGIPYSHYEAIIGDDENRTAYKYIKKYIGKNRD
jgi:hypothetical protein